MRDGHRVCMCECVQHILSQCARSRADLQISRRDSPESDPDSSWCVRYLSPLALFPELQPECCYGSLLQSDASVYASYLPSRRFLRLQHACCNLKRTLVQPDGTFHDGGALSRGRRPASIGSRYRPEQECATPRHTPPPILLALLPSPSPSCR